MHHLSLLRRTAILPHRVLVATAPSHKNNTRRLHLLISSHTNHLSLVLQQILFLPNTPPRNPSLLAMAFNKTFQVSSVPHNLVPSTATKVHHRIRLHMPVFPIVPQVCPLLLDYLNVHLLVLL
jgi:hypothetical protein